MTEMLLADGPMRATRDGALCRAEFERLSAELKSRSDAGRILVVIAAAGRAEQHLPRSIPRLLEQLSALRIGADILLGCNSGFEPRVVVDVVQRMTAVQFINARCTKENPAEPAPILTDDGRPLELPPPIAGNQYRVVVVRQAATPAAPGKLRMLSDLYGWIGNAIARKQSVPAYLLACDSESEFSALHPLLSHGADKPRLGKLIHRLVDDSTLQVVGARVRNVAFQETPSGVLEPEPSLPIPGFHLATNLVHARSRGFSWLHGAGMVGRTAAMVAVYSTVARLYPYTQADDAYAMALFTAAGLRSATEPGVAVTNYCPRGDSAEAAAQWDRWIGGTKEVTAAYGRDFSERCWTTAIAPTIASVVRLWLRDVFQAPRFRGKWKASLYGFRLLTLIRPYIRTRNRAKVQRGDDPGAVADWN